MYSALCMWINSGPFKLKASDWCSRKALSI